MKRQKKIGMNMWITGKIQGTIQNEMKKWQEWNMENIKRLVDRKGNAQLCRGITNIIQ
jgi:hypothetical protein